MRLLTFITLTLLSGCASHAPALNYSLAAKVVCCDSFEQIVYLNIMDGKQHKFDIDESSPAFNFPGGKSYFVAISLGSDAKQLTLITRMVGGFIPTSYVFWPSLMFLDENYKPTRTLQQIPMRRTNDLVSLTMGGPIWIAEFPLALGERYCIAYTLRSRLDNPIPIDTPGAGYVFNGGSGPTYVPMGGTHFSTSAAGGSISMELR
jgi:hypothetical protein